MQQCLRQHLRLAGFSVVGITTSAELVGLCCYITYYAHYLSAEEGGGSMRQRIAEDGDGRNLTQQDRYAQWESGFDERFASNPDSADNSSSTVPAILPTESPPQAPSLQMVAREMDPGALIGVGLTFFCVIASNILLLCGIWKRRLSLFLPWLLVHFALFCEAVVAILFCFGQAIGNKSYYLPLLAVFLIALFLLSVWFVAKDLFLALYLDRAQFASGEYSRDQMLEMQSYCHSSPRMSYVAALSDQQQMQRVAL